MTPIVRKNAAARACDAIQHFNRHKKARHNVRAPLRDYCFEGGVSESPFLLFQTRFQSFDDPVFFAGGKERQARRRFDAVSDHPGDEAQQIGDSLSFQRGGGAASAFQGGADGRPCGICNGDQHAVAGGVQGG